MPPRIYLDHAATTPLSAQARAAMMMAYDGWANPFFAACRGRVSRAPRWSRRAAGSPI